MPQQKWDSKNIPDQKGRVAIVTGSSSGIGYEAARVLATKNATVVLAVRNLEKGNTAVNKMTSGYQNADVRVIQLDLANLQSVQHFADLFRTKFERLDLLINNGGVMVPPYSKTKDGFELQFGTNHLGHFALTGLLIDVLLKTPNSRIVNVSSSAHNMGKLDFNDLQWEKRKYKKWQAYGDSKIANIYFTRELQKRLADNHADVTVAACHPGWTATELQRHTGMASFLNHFLAQGSDMGALPTLYAAVATDVKGADFFGPDGFMGMKGYPKKVESNKLSQDENIAKKLWDISEVLTGITYSI